MSHKPNIVSAPGTPLAERSVGELVAERPGRSRVFQSFGIDFCCQGGRTVREACEKKGLAVSTLLEQLEAELQCNASPTENPAALPLPDLTEYIVRKHHDFLRRELPRLHAMSARVSQVHGGHTPSLIRMFDVFHALQDDLLSHIAEEESSVFPAVVALSRGEIPARDLQESIAGKIHEHEDAGAALSRLRELSDGFQPPPGACNTYRALFAGLHDLEEDMHRHVHLENSVLFPAAQALVRQAAA